jgi:septum formation protein
MHSDNRHPPRLILASASQTRAKLLRAAGLDVEAVAPGVDEDEVKRSLRLEAAPADHVALTLAELKALRVSRSRPDALVVGADQTLQCGGLQFDKPPDLAHARAQLQALRGRRHELVSAAVAARGGASLWRETQRARLTMRPFTDAFLDGLGAQLFSRIEGDLFTVLGFPLLPFLEYLRAQGMLAR